MAIRKSGLLSNLDAQILAAKEPMLLACLSVQRAVYYARQGNIAEAKATLNEVRSRYNDRPDASVTSWLLLLEGLIGYFTDMRSTGYDRLLRSYAISAAAGLTALRGLSCAWLAHMDYVQANIEPMAKSIQEAWQLDADDDHGLLCRVSLVVAEALHFAGRTDLASQWYDRAKSHSIAGGDDVTLSAVIHNMAWLRMAEIRQATFEGRVATAQNLAKINAESSAHYDEAAGVHSLKDLHPLLRAQILSLAGNSQDACSIYERHLSSPELAGLSQSFQANLWADFAWCKANCGNLAAAEVLSKSAVRSLESCNQLDERAAAYSRLSQLNGMIGDQTESTRYRRLADAEWQKFRKLQHRVVDLLAQISFDEKAKPPPAPTPPAHTAAPYPPAAGA